MTRARLLLFALLTFAGGINAFAQGARPQGPPQSIEERTARMRKIDGFFPVYWDENTGQLFLEISRFNTEVLYSTGFAAGLGSNDIGIDRGALAGSRIIKFERVGPKILVVQPNYQFRADSQNQAEAKSVRDAFARSVTSFSDICSVSIIEASHFSSICVPSCSMKKWPVGWLARRPETLG